MLLCNYLTTILRTVSFNLYQPELYGVITNTQESLKCTGFFTTSLVNTKTTGLHSHPNSPFDLLHHLTTQHSICQYIQHSIGQYTQYSICQYIQHNIDQYIQHNIGQYTQSN